MTHRSRPGLFSALITAPVMAIAVAGPAGACENWFLDRTAFFDGGASYVIDCLAKGADATVTSKDGAFWTPLLFATGANFMERPDAAATKALLRAGVDPNAAHVYGTTPLHQAAGVRWLGWRARGHRDVETSIAIVSALLAAGADPNKRMVRHASVAAPQGRPTSIMRAARDMDFTGFEITQREECTPLMLAVMENESPKIVELLLNAGGDPSLGTKHENWTSLHLAGWPGNPDVIRLLLQHGGDPAAVTKDRRWTPLHVLSWSGGRNMADSVESVGILLEAGVDPAARDAKGRAAWDLIMDRHGRALRKAFDAGELSAQQRAILARLQKAARS